MQDSTWQKLDAAFTRYPVMRATNAPTPEEFDAAVGALGVTPCESYRDFVLRYGGAIVGSQSVVGLRGAPAMGADEASVVDVTLRFREDGWPGVRDWLVISTDLAGNPVGLDARGRIWKSDHDAGEIYAEAESFEAFLLKLLG